MKREIGRTIIISILTTLAVFFFLYYSHTSSLVNIFQYWSGMIVSVVLSTGIGLLILTISNYYDSLLPWNKSIAIRMGMEILSALMLVAIGALVFIYAYLKFVIIDIDVDFFTYITDGVTKFIILALVIILIYSLIRFFLFSFSRYYKTKIEVIASDKDQMALRLEVLKSQLSPHFLFNSLNTISSLANTNKRAAEKYIRELSITFKYILNNKSNSLVPIKDELDMVKAYVNMYRIKYGDSISINIDYSTSISESLIIPLTLQILVENAIKHNYFDESNPLEITVKEFKNRILVSNKIVERADKKSNPISDRSFKIGLENIRSRYSFYTSKDVEIEENTEFIVKLPAIINEN